MARSFDIVALAKRINKRREEHNRLHPGRRLRIDERLSRILANDPDYLPYREPVDGKRQRATRNPTIATLVEIANALDTTVGDLLGEPWPIGPAERKLMSEFVRVVDQLRTRSE